MASHNLRKPGKSRTLTIAMRTKFFKIAEGLFMPVRTKMIDVSDHPTQEGGGQEDQGDGGHPGLLVGDDPSRTDEA